MCIYIYAYNIYIHIRCTVYIYFWILYIMEAQSRPKENKMSPKVTPKRPINHKSICT